MKKVLQLVTLVTVVMTTTAFSQDYVDEKAMEADIAIQAQMMRSLRESIEKGKTDDMALKEVIRLIPFTSLWVDEQVGNFAGLVQESGIATNRVTTVMEGMIREVLSAVEKNEKGRVSWGIGDVLPLFEAFPKYDASPIIKECINSKSEDYRLYALQVYAEIAGEKSIPLIQEAIKAGRLNEKNRNNLYIHLSNFTIPKFKRDYKTNDVEKINAFLKEMKQAEQAKEKGGN